MRSARLALLRVARKEIRACWWHHHVSVLLWTALRRRRIRSASLAAAACMPGWWRHPRRRLWAPGFAGAIVRQRICALKPDCELDRPSERMATDPSLHWLREFEEFASFVRAQAGRDFDASRGGGVGDPWFQEILGPEVHVPAQLTPAANGHRGLVPARRAPRSWRSYAAGERWAGLVARIWLTDVGGLDHGGSGPGPRG